MDSKSGEVASASASSVSASASSASPSPVPPPPRKRHRGDEPPRQSPPQPHAGSNGSGSGSGGTPSEQGSEQGEEAGVAASGAASSSLSGAASGGDKRSQSWQGNAPRHRQQRRLSWSESDHRDFVSAIFDVGLKHSSPSALMEQMRDPHLGRCHIDLTVERVKSHLQKYRLNRDKSKKEFMEAYDAAMEQYHDGSWLAQSQGAATPKSGEVAAYLTHETMNDSKGSGTSSTSGGRGATTSGSGVPAPLVPLLQGGAVPGGGSTLVLPPMSEADMRTPLGQSVRHLVGLFGTLTEQLRQKRAAEQARQGQPPLPPSGIAGSQLSAAGNVANDGGGREATVMAVHKVAATSTPQPLVALGQARPRAQQGPPMAVPQAQAQAHMQAAPGGVSPGAPMATAPALRLGPPLPAAAVVSPAVATVAPTHAPPPPLPPPRQQQQWPQANPPPPGSPQRMWPLAAQQRQPLALQPPLPTRVNPGYALASTNATVPILPRGGGGGESVAANASSGVGIGAVPPAGGAAAPPQVQPTQLPPTATSQPGGTPA